MNAEQLANAIEALADDTTVMKNRELCEMLCNLSDVIRTRNGIAIQAEWRDAESVAKSFMLYANIYAQSTPKRKKIK